MSHWGWIQGQTKAQFVNIVVASIEINKEIEMTTCRVHLTAKNFLIDVNGRFKVSHFGSRKLSHVYSPTELSSSICLLAGNYFL